MMGHVRLVRFVHAVSHVLPNDTCTCICYVDAAQFSQRRHDPEVEAEEDDRKYNAPPVPLHSQTNIEGRPKSSTKQMNVVFEQGFGITTSQ